MAANLPQHDAAARLHAANTEWIIHLSRDFPQDAETVWNAITDADQLAHWTPFHPDRNLDTVGPVHLTMIDGEEGDGDVLPSEVTDATRPESLVYTWGADRLRFDLFEEDGGVKLALAHNFADRNSASSFAAGWHLCLGALELLLNGEDVPSVVGMNAMEHGYEDLERDYRAIFDEQTESQYPDDRTLQQ